MKMFCLHVTIQAEPLVIDLKDLFQVIFNIRKKETEASQKVTDLEAFHLILEKHDFFQKLDSKNISSLKKREAFWCGHLGGNVE